MWPFNKFRRNKKRKLDEFKIVNVDFKNAVINNNNKSIARHEPLPDERRKEIEQIFGIGLGILSKYLLERNGMKCDYKINGERIEDISQLPSMDISERIQLAIKEERYEDAAKLKQIMDSKANTPNHLHFDTNSEPEN